MRTLGILTLIVFIAAACARFPLAGVAPPTAGQPQAAEAAVEAGRRIVELQCVSCHAVRSADASRHPKAPALRTLTERYPVAGLADAFALGIMTGHPDMPEFRLSRAQVEAIAAYLESIQTRQGASLGGRSSPPRETRASAASQSTGFGAGRNELH